jgi:hypothetical protein
MPSLFGNNGSDSRPVRPSSTDCRGWPVSPTDIVEVPLVLPPLYLEIEAAAQGGIYRFNCN